MHWWRGTAICMYYVKAIFPATTSCIDRIKVTQLTKLYLVNAPIYPHAFIQRSNALWRHLSCFVYLTADMQRNVSKKARLRHKVWYYVAGYTITVIKYKWYLDLGRKRKKPCLSLASPKYSLNFKKATI